MTTAKYTVTYPATPGSRPTATPAATLREARKIAAAAGRERRDLTYQDVVIRGPRGAEYAGPAR